MNCDYSRADLSRGRFRPVTGLFIFFWRQRKKNFCRNAVSIQQQTSHHARKYVKIARANAVNVIIPILQTPAFTGLSLCHRPYVYSVHYSRRLTTYRIRRNKIGWVRRNADFPHFGWSSAAAIRVPHAMLSRYTVDANAKPNASRRGAAKRVKSE